jgi:hypothetical protein
MSEAHIAYINAMLKLRLLPHRLKEVLIVCIAKETGGFRPLSLFEEILKTVEGTVTHRIANARAKIGSRVLSETNSVYAKGRGTYYVRAAVLEDAIDREKKVTIVQMDYES